MYQRMCFIFLVRFFCFCLCLSTYVTNSRCTAANNGKFTTCHSITIYVEDNWGGDETRINYIGMLLYSSLLTKLSLLLLTFPYLYQVSRALPRIWKDKLYTPYTSYVVWRTWRKHSHPLVHQQNLDSKRNCVLFSSWSFSNINFIICVVVSLHMNDAWWWTQKK